MSRLSRLTWVDLDGSTRLHGLLRIGLVLLLWSSWGYPFVLHFDLDPLRVVLGCLFFVGSLLWGAGLATPVVGPLVAAALVAAVVLLGQGDAGSAWLQQHRQLPALLAVLFAFAPSGRSLSVDRSLALRRGGPAPDERGPLWTLRLLQLAGSLVLLVTALGQARGDWLSGAHFVEAPQAGRYLAWTLFLANLVGALGPWWRRTRGPSIVLVSLVYLGVYVLMQVDTIGLVVIWLLLAHLPPDAVHRGLDRLHGAQGTRHQLGNSPGSPEE